MSENIKVSEVSDILRHQLEGIDTRVQLDEIGTVLQVSDGVARIYGLRNAEANELLEFDNGIKAIVMNLEEDNVGAVLLGPTDKIKEGYVVKRTKRIASIMVGEGMLGRVIDPLGAPLDGKGLIGGELCEMPLERKAPGVIFRQPVNQPLQTGLKAVDAMIPIGRGQRELIIGDRQTGKTAIAIDTIINQRANYEAGVGRLSTMPFQSSSGGSGRKCSSSFLRYSIKSKSLICRSFPYIGLFSLQASSSPCGIAKPMCLLLFRECGLSPCGFSARIRKD